MKFPVTLLSLVAVLPIAQATTYYVDFDGGNDASAGTSTGTAWKTLPGTRKADDTGYVSTAFGGSVFTYNANKVPAGTIFKIKRGTTLDSSKGGWIRIDSLWYSNGTSGSPIVFQADSGWGSGTITIDGTGITMPSYRGLINIDTRDYITWDGVATSGIKIQNTSWNGIRVYDSGTNGITLKNLEVAYGPNALVAIYSTDKATPAHLSGVTLDNVIAHDTTGTQDTSSCFYLDFVSNFTVTNCTAYESGDGSDGFHIESSQYGWVTNCTSHDTGEEGFDMSRDGSYKTRDDSYYITIRDCIGYDNRVHNFDHNSGSHHIAWINCFGWRTTRGQAGDPNFGVHEGTAGPNWWVNCTSSKSFDRGISFGYAANPWSIPGGTYNQYMLNFASYGDSTYSTVGSRAGSVWIDNDPSGITSSWQFVNCLLGTTSTNYGTVNYKSTIYSASNVANGTGGFSGIGTNCITSDPIWKISSPTVWHIDNETPDTGSPCINAGVWPFKTNGTGSSSTSLVTTNSYEMTVSRFFRAGDAIRIQGGTTGTVASVTDPNTITLTSPLSWTNNLGVWYNEGLTTPRIGAYRNTGAGNSPPVISITSPTTGQTFTTADSISFGGIATDAEDGTISANIIWSSSIDGALGTGASITHTLTSSVTPHVITASITDAASNTVTAEVSITVSAPSPPPAPSARRPGRPRTFIQ